MKEDDKLDRSDFRKDIIEQDRRHIITDMDAHPDFLIPVKGFYNEDGYQAFSPRENIRIKGSGGLNFVHGGASLQEMVVPVIQYRFLRSGYKAYTEHKDKYDANNNEELYKELLLATCNDMSQYLPGMFKPIDDFMTLLFPSNLLREESVLGRLISDIDEDSWMDQVQIIGWLYQYYISEKHENVIDPLHGKEISKDDMPAATQLFTPDWIVRYMTENSLGRLWLDGHPDTDIKANWKYYLAEAEQEESVKIELNKIKAEHAKLRPEDIRFLDPCMGSGHILVYAFDVFMQIYVSEGWTEREAAKSILQNNLYGLDIDERAYQLSYFALMMKARQYNRRILSEGITPNVMAIEESNTFNKELLRRFGDLKPLAERVVNTYIDAKEYGSILNVEFTKEELDSLEERLDEIDRMSSYGNLLVQMESDQLLHDFYPFLKQTRIMSQKYECVVTNLHFDTGRKGTDRNGGSGGERQPELRTSGHRVQMCRPDRKTSA